MRKLNTAFIFLFLAVTTFAQPPQVTTTAGTGSNIWPFGSSATSNNNKVQWLYHPSDFQGSGLTAGVITDIFIKTVNPIVSTTFTNLTFAMGTTNLTAFTSGPFLPVDTVFTRASYRIDNISADGWIRIPLDKPFNYSGSENLVIEGSHTGYTDPITIRHSTITTGNRRMYGNHLSTTGTATVNQMDVGLNIVEIACTTPIGSGVVFSTPVQTCSWGQIQLDLQGNSFGIGQTYQWQASTDNVSWVNVTNPSPSSYFVTTQSVSTYYRAILACNGTTIETASELVPTPPPVSGTYTINKLLPAGGGNFQSFTDAVNFIGCGIDGPVVFNVEPNSGPYIEQVVFPEVPGTSAINTITVNGNDNTIEFAPTASARHIMQFRGTDYVTVNDLTIKTTDNTHGWAVHLTKQADHITLKRCVLSVASVNQSETNLANSIALLASASYTLVASGNNANYLTVDSCTLEGGYQTIYLLGGSTEASKHNKIINSTIRDFYVTGVKISNNDSAVVANNRISRPNRTTNGSLVMIDILAGNTNMEVDANRLHDSHTSATSITGSVTGISITNCDAPAGSENKITNNLIYNFNNIGTMTGLSNNNSDGVMYYHNTVVLANSITNNAFANTRGFYQNGEAERIHLRNNLIYINRGGTGVKHALYFNTATTSFTSNNNILVKVSPTPATNGVAYLTTNYATLAEWKLGNSNAYDQASFDNDPLFIDTAAFNFTPTAIAVTNAGAPVGVEWDINGKARSTTTPDIGAIEWDEALPVKLLDFAAVKSGMDARLSWSTVTEEDLASFTIERSIDGYNFERIGTVAAIGNSNNLQFYNYTDANVLSLLPAVYYRLKMQDKDGAFTYSTIILLKTGSKTFSVTAFPNPVIKEGLVKITTSEAGAVKLKITSSTGVLTGIINTRLQPGVNVISIPARYLAQPGMYIITVESGENKQVLRVVK